jgi:hypothetical protein
MENRRLKVNFVSQGSAQLASHRMRVMKTAELLNCCNEFFECTIKSNTDFHADVNIFNKHFDPKGNLDGLSKGKDLGYLTVMDVCDDHFDRANGDYYKKACELADVVMCNTERMKARIKEATGVDACIVPDPVTFNWEEPNVVERAKDDDYEARLLWYGHGSNLKPLVPWLNNVDRPITIMSNGKIEHEKADYIPWRPNLVEGIIDSYDIVLIPTTQEDWAKCKSPNRVTDALAAGKLVITDSSEIYEEFKDYIVTIDGVDSLQAAINYWRDDSKGLQEMIAKGQEYVRENYGYDRIVDTWLEVFRVNSLIEGYKVYGEKG